MTQTRDDVQAAITLFSQAAGPKVQDVGPVAARQMLVAMTAMIERPAPPLARREDFTIPGPAGDIPARLYQAGAVAGNAPLIVYYHGGGWVLGNLDTHDSLCAEIAVLTGWSVVAVDYRLAPEAPFPAGVEDAIAAARWLAGAHAITGHPISGLIVAGDSAGGNLAAVTARALADEVKLLAQWLIYPGTDMQWSTGSMAEFSTGYLLDRDGMDWFLGHYAPVTDDARASPLRAVRWDGLPPTLLFTCGLDPLRDQGRAYAARLVEAGNRLIYREAAGQIHGALSLRKVIPSAQDDLVALVADLKALLA